MAPSIRRLVRRPKRSRPMTTSDPHLLAAQDAVIMGRPENPWAPGAPQHHLYEAAYQETRASLPEDWAPEWPRHNKRRQK